MAQLQPVRGTHDLLPEDERRHRAVGERARAVAETYGFQSIATPIFEFTELFVRSVGETSDIVTKEMYSFTDRGGEAITLRPENTASVARAVLSNGLLQSLPLKFFYVGPMFRYERPQKGRLRQFHQIGVELIGAAQPLADVEVIACAADVLDRLGILDRVRLDLNTLGDAESRATYRAKLVEYFSDLRDRLSPDSQMRLDKNPLRILDSKDDGDRRLIADAPRFEASLNAASLDFFAAVTNGLDKLGIAWVREQKLVRGLDYYSHTIFEFVTDALGSQGTVLAGGRYDGLIADLGGPPTPGVGWAAGVERLSMMLADAPPAPRPVAVIPLGDVAEAAALPLVRSLRRAGVPVDIAYGGAMKKRMQRADRVSARYAVILGDDELAKGVAALRDLDSGDQAEVPLTDLQGYLLAKGMKA